MNLDFKKNLRSTAMQSLRSRQSVAPPRKGARPAGGVPGSGSTRLTKGTGAGPRQTPARKNTKVDDRIKKRMSMRYADISNPTEPSGIPDMPSIPGGIGITGQAGRFRARDEAVRDRSLSKDDIRVVQDDKKLLDSKEFDPDACLCLSLVLPSCLFKRTTQF